MKKIYIISIKKVSSTLPNIPIGFVCVWFRIQEINFSAIFGDLEVESGINTAQKREESQGGGLFRDEGNEWDGWREWG